MHYTLNPGDVTTLAVAVALAKKAGESASKAAAKAQLTESESEGMELAGYAEEAQQFLARYQAGRVELNNGCLRACKTGLQLLFDKVKKSKDSDTEIGVDTTAHDDRLEDLRQVARKLRLTEQLDIDDERDAADDQAVKERTTITLSVPGKEPVTATAAAMERALDHLEAQKKPRGRRSSVREAFAAEGADV